MEAKPEFYADWFKWLEGKTSALVHIAPLTLFALTTEVSALVKKDVALWQSLATAVHGSGLQIAVQVGTWVAQHGDPLKGTRETMRAIRAKYGEVPHAK